MSGTTPPAPPHRTSDPRSPLERVAWPDLDDDVLAHLEAAGQRRSYADGEAVFDAGQGGYDFVHVLRGTIEVVDPRDDHVVVAIAAGNFMGELGLLMGQGTFMGARAAGHVEALVVDDAALRRLIATVPEVADTVVSAFAARRRLLLQWDEGGLALVGHAEDPATVDLRQFLSRNRIPSRFVDAADADEAASVLDACGVDPAVLADGPVAVTGASVPWVHPTRTQLAEALGFDLAPPDDELVDVVVVGAGPAGLAAGVYAASEGLSVVVVDDTAIGGQAGSSSRIENYLGFPTGVSGTELAFLGGIQAVKFGARLTIPRRATRLEAVEDGFVVTLDDDRGLRARTVVLAMGVRYRRLPLARLEEFEGAGVYYAATELEARYCMGTQAVVVGGGNSAGQAAMFLSRVADRTHVLVRGDGLAATMSAYLSTRIDSDPAIDLHTGTEVVELHGEDHLEAVTVRGPDGATSRIDTRALFVMIGAAPNTEWLGGQVELDDHGFVATQQASQTFGTSLPGVYAVGDLRAGSVKRVASAVGEGSVVVAGVHRHLAQLDRPDD